MEIVLLENIRKLGAFGEVVDVKNGFARNYLLPRKKAMIANKGNLALFESRKAEMTEKNAELLAEAKKMHSLINKAFVLLVRQASEEGKLFGSVSAREVIEQLNENHDIALIKAVADGINSLKTIGVHEMQFVLHPEVTSDVRVIIARSEFEAGEAKKAYLNPPKIKADAGEAAKKFVAEEAVISDEEGEDDAAEDISEIAD